MERKRFDEIESHRLNYLVSHRVVSSIARVALGAKFYGTENIPPAGTGVLATANHSHWTDVFLFPAGVKDRHVSFVAKKEVYDTPVMGSLFRKWDSIPLDRENPQPSTTKEVVERLRAGRLVAVLPEGTRSHGNELGPFHVGVARWARMAKVSTIPSAIRVETSLKDAILHRNAEVIFGEAIEPPQTKQEEPEFLEELRSRIENIHNS